MMPPAGRGGESLQQLFSAENKIPAAGNEKSQGASQKNGSKRNLKIKKKNNRRGKKSPEPKHQGFSQACFRAIT